MAATIILLYFSFQPQLFEAAQQLRIEGKPAAAEALLLSAPASTPAERPVRLLLLASVRLDQAETDSARGLFLRVAADPFSSPALRALAHARILQTWLQQGDLASASHHLGSLPTPLTPEPLLLAWAALVQASTKRLEECRKLLQSIDPQAGDPETWIVVAQAAAMLGDRTIFRQSLALSEKASFAQPWMEFPLLAAQVQVAQRVGDAEAIEGLRSRIWPILEEYAASHKLMTPLACQILQPVARGTQRKQLRAWCAGVPQSAMAHTVAAGALR